MAATMGLMLASFGATRGEETTRRMGGADPRADAAGRSAITLPRLVKYDEDGNVPTRLLILMESSRLAASPGLVGGLPGVSNLRRIGRSGIRAAGAAGSDWYVAELTETASAAEAMEMLLRLPEIRHVEPDYRCRLATTPETVTSVADDPQAAFQHALFAIDVSRAWAIEPGDPEVVVAVIDTGMDLTHPDLVEQLWHNADEVINGIDDDGNGYIDDVNGYDFVNGDQDPADDHDHGTHVAGILSATRNNGVGTAGVANVRIMPLKALDALGDGSASAVLEAINYAIENGADIINLSLSFNNQYVVSVGQACDQAAAADIVMVAATGNDSADQIGFPSSMPAVIGVGAIDSNDQLGTFTNVGAGMDMVAPGVDVLSAVAGGGYGRMSGSSMAAPHVAGVAALLRSAYPDYDATTVREILAATCSDLGVPGYDGWFGFGKLDAGEALAMAATASIDLAPVLNPVESMDDEYEPNDSSAKAWHIEPGGPYQLVCRDEDWFRLELEAASRVSAVLNGDSGDLDMFLFDTAGVEQARSTGTRSNELIDATVPAGAYLLAVAPHGGRGGPYTLRVMVEPSDASPGQTIPMGCGGGTGPMLAAGLAGWICAAGGTRIRAARAETGGRADASWRS